MRIDLAACLPAGQPPTRGAPGPRGSGPAPRPAAGMRALWASALALWLLGALRAFPQVNGARRLGVARVRTPLPSLDRPGRVHRDVSAPCLAGVRDAGHLQGQRVSGAGGQPCQSLHSRRPADAPEVFGAQEQRPGGALVPNFASVTTGP